MSFSTQPVRANGDDIDVSHTNGLRQAGVDLETSLIALLAGVLASPDSNDATAGAITALATASKGSIRLTGAVTSVKGLANGADGRIVFVINVSGADTPVKHLDAGAIAANQIHTGTGIDATLQNGAVFIFKYDATSSLWRIIGGGGGSSALSFGSRGSPRSIVAATGITSGAGHMSTVAVSQNIYAQGSAAGDSLAATITPGTIDGQTMKIIGRSDTQTVSLDSTTTNLQINGPVTLGAGNMIHLLWDTTNWIEISRSV